MVIGVCGYGYSGSGAVLDFLCEWNTCSCNLNIPEFDFLYLPHGIQDLEYQLLIRKTRYLSSNAALKDYKKLICGLDSPRSYYRKLTGNCFRTRSLEFIDELSQVTWRGYVPLEKYCERWFYQRLIGVKLRIVRLYEKLTDKKWPYSKRSIMYLSVDPKEFYDKVKHYLRDIIEMLGFDLSKTILLNQPFDVYEPQRSMKFFDSPKAVLVDRDPRDIYVLAKCYLKSKGNFIPTDNVENFIKYHKLVRNNIPDRTDICCIRYENMIYDYEATARKLMDFLEFTTDGWERKKYFDPAVSINNTQLFLKHPELSGDIQQIEKELAEYIYPFERFECKPQHSCMPF